MASRAATTKGNLHWTRNRGRDGWSVPTDVADDMTVESINVILEKNTLGRKRRGSKTQLFTGDAFTGYNAVALFVPKTGETKAEIYINSADAVQKILRVAGGTAAVNMTLADPITGVSVSSWAQLNNKLYIAYDSDVNRLHVVAPEESTTAVRRVGLAVPGAPPVADTGPGSYPGIARSYRVQWRVKSGTTIVRQSDLGAAVPFTPNGTSQGVLITQPTPLPGEGETHWAVYVSTDSATYFQLAELPIATTTYTDVTVTAQYLLNPEAQDEGASTPWPSVKFLLSTGERLVGFGVYETTAGDSLVPKNGRVYFSPVLDTTDQDDDERVSNTVDFQGWIDIARNAGSEDRALGGPIDNNIFVFQSRGTYMLVPTGQAEQPYKRIIIHPRIGAISHESTFMGEDESGAPALYWLDPIRGPYRYGASGMEWCGYDMQDVWATMNLTATVRVGIGVYEPELRACIWGVATGGSDAINELIIFFVREGQPTSVEGVRGGWTRWNENVASTFRCAVMLPEIIGAVMSRQLKPYLGNATVLNRWHDESVQTDAGVSYGATIKSKSYVGRLDQRTRFGKSYVQANAVAGVTIQQLLTRNFGDEAARVSTISLNPGGAESRMIRKFENAALADAQAIQITLGDAVPIDNGWTLDEWFATIEPTEEA